MGCTEKEWCYHLHQKI